MNITEKLARAMIRFDPNVSDPELQYELYEDKYNKQATVLLEAIGITDLLENKDTVVEAMIEENEYWGDNFCYGDPYKVCEYARRILRHQRRMVGL